MSHQGEPPVSIAQWIARAVAVVILIPLRLVWEGVKLCGKVVVLSLVFLAEHLLFPLCSFTWHWVIRPLWLFCKDFLWGWLLQQVLWGLILTPVLAFVLDFVLRPLRHAIERWLWQRVLRPALTWLWRAVLRPVLEFVLGALWLTIEWLIVRPLVVLWRYVLKPLGRALGATLRFGWRVATRVVRVLLVIPCAFVYRIALRPVLVALAAVWVLLVARPVAWVYRTVLRPMNKWAAEIVTSVFGK
ncbi:hypothetical protein ACTD5D_26050 [Nocardia takedensis]|uniref:hypothetical protein n=1 Tax=Nocardia takedensis TaxID=259390 RepID=UPI0002EB133D|nr:hypothetical protein [Nocardia takedensis]